MIPIKFLGSEITFLNSPNINVCFTAHVDRIFSETEVRCAVNRLVKRHPSLLYAIKTDGNGRKYYDDSGEAEVHILPATDLLTVYKQTDSVPFDFEKSLVKLYVLNGGNCSDIMLIGHHVIADGIGYLNLFRDTFAALDGKLSDEVFAVPENNGVVGSKPGFLLSLLAAVLNIKWQKQGKLFTDEEYRLLFTEYRSKYIPQVLLRQIEGGFIYRLRENCKKQSITVNEAICTSFCRAILDTQKRTALRVGVAASTRNNMKINVQNTLGNYQTGIAAMVTNYDEVAEKTRSQLNNPRIRFQAVHLISKLKRSLIESVMFAAYGDYKAQVSCRLADILGERRNDKAVGFSNLGVQDFGGYSFTVSNEQFICPAFPQNFLTVGIMTVGDTLKFCLRYNTPEISDAEIAAIYEKAVSYLREI